MRGTGITANGNHLLFGTRKLPTEKEKENALREQEKELKRLHAEKVKAAQRIRAEKFFSDAQKKIVSAGTLNYINIQAFDENKIDIEWKGSQVIVKSKDGYIAFFKDSVLHREDGPAETYPLPNGVWQNWFQNGKLHRENGPAIVHPGGEFWYQKGQRHREGGPAATESRNGKPLRRYWMIHDQLHREDGPAREDFEADSFYWYYRGRIHREDGPAFYKGKKIVNGKEQWEQEAFYINDKEIKKRKVGKAARDFHKRNQGDVEMG